jgi:NAD(P)-dependent dehydrogenase (short-subunit alcohol dehydrogenase family)
MSIDLSGQVAVVTGGNGGIGLGMAEGLVDAGAAVAVWARNPDKNAAAVEALEARGGKARAASGAGCAAIALQVDVGSEESIAAAVRETVDRLGRIDSCIANAGTHGPGSILTTSLEDWHRSIRINLDGAFLTIRDCARQMVEQGEGGAIVAISSTSAIHGAPMTLPYATAKTGLLGLVRSSAVALARHGIRVNAVLPGWTRTEMAEAGFQNDRFRDVTTGRTPVRRWAGGEDYRDIAAYLCDKSVSFHTGDTLVVDGGYTIF